MTGSIDREPPSATERVARLRLHVQQMTLSDLVSSEVLAFDREENVVREGRRFDVKWDELFG